jgi:glycosyltransferase involved in cell wall biosynthesis
MNILHLTWTLGIGGSEEMLVDIVNEQCRTAQVSIIVVNEPVDRCTLDRLNAAVKVVCLHRKPGSSSPLPFIRLNWLVHRFRADIVHAHNWTLIKTVPYRPFKAVLTLHTTRDADQFDRSVARYDLIFAVSHAVATYVHERTTDIQPTVVLNGIRCDDIRSERRRRDKVFRIVQVARLEHREKGQDILVRALARLRNQSGGESIQVDFVGTGSSREYLEGLVRSLGLNKSVSFRGLIDRPEVYQQLCNYDLLVQPSRFEGFGLTVAEAMTAGIPVLTSDIEGPKELIDGGRLGFLFRCDDDADCARQIQHVRHLQDTPVLNQLLSAAKDHALRHFDVKRTAREYVRQYQNIFSLQSQLAPSLSSGKEVDPKRP